MLKFSPANAKTKNLVKVAELQKYLTGNRKVYSLDLLSGWTCPGALDCLAKVYVESGRRRLVDGPHTQFRCFSASQEVVYPNVYAARKFNTEIITGIRGYKRIAEVICSSLPKNAGIIRVHVAGDFFKLAYLEGMVEAAELRPDVLFYAYTKMINHLNQVDMLDPSNGAIRENFLITASLGGKYDDLIDRFGIRTARVIFAESDANILRLPIDHNDSHAATMGGDFCLLLHGIQPAGSKAAKALKALKGKGTYSR